MLKLSKIKKVADTVDTEWKSPVAEAIIQKWNCDRDSLYFYRVSSNFIFVFRENGQLRFLRFIDTAERDVSAIQAEMNLLGYLNGKKLNAVKPVPSTDGHMVEVVATEWGSFAAVVFEAMDGQTFEVEELDALQFKGWGAALGELHETMKRMPKEMSRNRPDVKDLLEFVDRTVGEDDTAIRTELDEVSKWLQSLPSSLGNYGLIHFDFELDNLKFIEGRVGILDFDDSISCWYAADIAFALRDLIPEEIDLNNKSFKSFMQGYMQETQIEPEMLGHLQGFRRLHDLVVYAKLLDAVDTDAATAFPGWMSSLPNRLQEKIDEYRLAARRKLRI